MQVRQVEGPQSFRNRGSYSFKQVNGRSPGVELLTATYLLHNQMGEAGKAFFHALRKPVQFRFPLTSMNIPILLYYMY